MRVLDDAGLTDVERRAIEEVARRLKAELPVTRVILFGSKARGDARPDSDVDLLVLTSDPVTRKLRREIRDRLYESVLRDDVLLTSLVVSEQDWSHGMIRYMLVHSEVERDGCEI